MVVVLADVASLNRFDSESSFAAEPPAEIWMLVLGLADFASSRHLFRKRMPLLKLLLVPESDLAGLNLEECLGYLPILRRRLCHREQGHSVALHDSKHCDFRSALKYSHEFRRELCCPFLLHLIRQHRLEEFRPSQ